MTEQEAERLKVRTKWSGKANVCIYCGAVPERFYIVTGHDHTDDSIDWCLCRETNTTIESLTRENAQLKSVIAEQKEEIQSLAWYKLEGGGLEASVSCQLAEQSTLIEKLGKALRKEAQIYIENDPEDGPPEDMAEALAELAKWREGK